MKNLSNWRSVRVWELNVERELRQRHVLPLHGFVIGSIVTGLMALASVAQFHASASQPLALRYAITLGLGYIAYLIVLRLWVSLLLKRERWDGDLPFDGIGSGADGATVSEAPVQFISGGGGDFGGGGASGEFGGVDVGAADVAGGAVQVAVAADEGAVVVVPVIAVFLIGFAVVFGAGALMFLYFGWDVLLAVAIEVAFGYVSARTALQVVREGWLSAAIRLTWKPLLGALFCAVLLGGVIDVFLPAADSLPQAIHLLRTAHWR